MKISHFAVSSIGVCLIGLAGCSPSDKRQTQVEARRAGEAVKKELKNDAQFVKQEALKAREETQKGVKKLKAAVDSDDHHRAGDDTNR